jgi:hypothetical protein
MENVQPTAVNPLKKFFRQPKFYIRLPSSGNFYPPGSLEVTENGEYPVYPMTAKDEIAMKTPDALLNGQSTVDMIQSCMPNIKNAWSIPSIDIDAILVAIRMATYGEKLDITINIPDTEITKTYETDLRIVLDHLLNATFDPEVVISGEMTAFIRPLTYMEFTKTAIKSLEEQRIFSLVNDDSIDDEKKIEIFNKSFRNLTQITVGVVSQTVVRIVTPDGEVSDQKFIKEFIENSDKEFYNQIVKHFEEQKEKFKIKPFKVITTEDERSQGAPDEFDCPIELDGSNFFA